METTKFIEKELNPEVEINLPDEEEMIKKRIKQKIEQSGLNIYF